MTICQRIVVMMSLSAAGLLTAPVVAQISCNKWWQYSASQFGQDVFGSPIFADRSSENCINPDDVCLSYGYSVTDSSGNHYHYFYGECSTGGSNCSSKEAGAIALYNGSGYSISNYSCASCATDDCNNVLVGPSVDMETPSKCYEFNTQDGTSFTNRVEERCTSSDSQCYSATYSLFGTIVNLGGCAYGSILDCAGLSSMLVAGSAGYVSHVDCEECTGDLCNDEVVELSPAHAASPGTAATIVVALATLATMPHLG